MITSLSATRVWRRLALASLVCLPLAGCGSPAPYGLAPVSGTVTLDGAPVPYTQVTFSPKGSAENPNPGPGSVATCDENGKFELKTSSGEPGAVIGPHAVKISAKGPPQSRSSDVSQGPPPKDAFPPRYNDNSDLAYEVPADGTTAADFKLTTSP
jgi:hypothetical protein